MTEAEWIAFFRRPEIPAFNAAMLADPDNDLPRLVFADWVEENCPHTPFVMALRRSIANPHTPEWVPNFSMVVKGHELRLWRGRLEVGIDFSDPDFDAEPDAFVKTAWMSDWVGRLKVRGVTDASNPIMCESRLEHLEWLDFFDAIRFNPFHLQVFFQKWIRPDTLVYLKVIDLRLCHLYDAAMQRLADAPSLASLKELRISTEYLGEVGRRHLANSPYLPEHIRAQFRRPT